MLINPSFVFENNIDEDVLPEGAGGAYFSNSMKIVCVSPEFCLYEIGHKVDHVYGMISMSDEWINAVTEHINSDGAESYIKDFPGLPNNGCYELDNGGCWGGYAELYSEILGVSGGDKNNIPSELLKFYDWDMIEKEISMDYSGKN